MNTILHPVAGGQKQDRHIAFLAQYLNDLPAIQPWQHHVEHNSVVSILKRPKQAVGAVTRQIDAVPGLAQPFLQVITRTDVVFNYQYPHCRHLITPAEILAASADMLDDINVIKPTWCCPCCSTMLNRQPKQRRTL
ncbi:hypothetical protein D3C80_1526990 [compost metagenome]